MKFYDIDELAKKYGKGNKYLATSLVAERAVRLGERGSDNDPEGEKYLSEALSEFELGLIDKEGNRIMTEDEVAAEAAAAEKIARELTEAMTSAA